MSAYDNDQLFDFSPPLPPKLHQKAPPIPPKLNLEHRDIILKDKFGEKGARKSKINKNSSPKTRPKRNTIVQNEGYRFVEQDVQDFDCVQNDSSLIYENKNILLSNDAEKELDKKSTSLLTKIRSFFTKKKPKKIKSKECNDNEYFSTHKSDKIVSYNTKGFSGTTEDVCTCSEINRSWYGSSQGSRSNRILSGNNQFHAVRQQHFHFNCVPVCPIYNQCHHQCRHHCQTELLSQFNPQNHDFSSLNRCFNCQICICNTHFHSRAPSFGNFTSFSACSRSSQSNHDRHLIENRSQETNDLISDSRLVVLPNSVLPVNQAFSQEVDPLTMSLHENLQLLRKAGWYWGPLKSDEAEEIMADRCDGTFIVRDSSHAEYLFSITFRVNNNTHHTRIQFSQNKFWLNQEIGTDGFKTVVDLIDDTVHESQNGKFKFFQNIDNLQLPTYAVILLYPLSRFRVMTSLQHIARFVIVSRVRSDHLAQLPLPDDLVSYLQDKDHHYVENFYNYVNIMKAADCLAIT